MSRVVLVVLAAYGCVPGASTRREAPVNEGGPNGGDVATVSSQRPAVRLQVEPTDGVPATAFPAGVGGLRFGASAAEVLEFCAVHGGTVATELDELTCALPRSAMDLGFPVQRLVARLCAGEVCAIRLDAPGEARARISERIVERYGAAAAVPMGASEQCEARSSGRWRWRDAGFIALDHCGGSAILIFAQERAGDVFEAGY